MPSRRAPVAVTRILPLLTAACGPSPAPDTPIVPAPAGPHPTGRTSFHWRDEAREELETRAAGDRRELMVHVFHPAAPGSRGERAVYMPDADAMAAAWSAAQLACVSALRAASLADAPLPPGDVRYPVLVFAPGGGMKALAYHALLEDLASHGWVVAAIDPPYNARAVRFPDGRVLGSLPPEERGWPRTRDPAEERRQYRERVEHWARDVSFVIDRLAALDAGDGRFAGRLDLGRGVGVFGHSRGGQAAGTVRLLDPRVRGAINIDGTAGEYCFMPVLGEDDSGTQPFLWIQGPLPPPPTDQQLQRANRTREEFQAEMQRLLAAWNRRLAGVRGGALRVCMDHPGLEHIDFSDEPLWDAGLAAADRAGKLATLARARAWVRAFFAGTVRGEWPELQALAAGGVAHETVHAFGRIWP